MEYDDANNVNVSVRVVVVAGGKVDENAMLNDVGELAEEGATVWERGSAEVDVMMTSTLGQRVTVTVTMMFEVRLIRES